MTVTLTPAMAWAFFQSGPNACVLIFMNNFYTEGGLIWRLFFQSFANPSGTQRCRKRGGGRKWNEVSHSSSLVMMWVHEIALLCLTGQLTEVGELGSRRWLEVSLSWSATGFWATLTNNLKDSGPKPVDAGRRQFHKSSSFTCVTWYMSPLVERFEFYLMESRGSLNPPNKKYSVTNIGNLNWI